MADTTFITNEQGNSLKERLEEILKVCKSVDIMTGYLYSSGIESLLEIFKDVEKIRILVGISTDAKISNLLTQETVAENVCDTLINSHSSLSVIADWLKTGKLEIKFYQERHIHAKLYIFNFKDGFIDKGRLILGSSNFSLCGISNNIELNVELKNKEDYLYAKELFNRLWEDSTDLTVNVNNNITTKIKVVKEVKTLQDFVEKIIFEKNKDSIMIKNFDVFDNVLTSFKKLEYQRHAVLQALLMLKKYNGCFLADVVGLGKTYIAALIAKTLNVETLIIAPPMLLNPNNPSAWPDVCNTLGVKATFLSSAKLDSIVNTEKYELVIVDEAHKFRNSNTKGYKNLERICVGKKVLLITATPLNNSIKELFNLIRLFINPLSSLTTGEKDTVGSIFKRIETEINKHERFSDTYYNAIENGMKDLRDKILRHILIRRTRKEIETYYKEDIKNINFPTVHPPKPILYSLKEKDKVDLTIQKIVNLKYARYSVAEENLNVKGIIKVLLLKRLDSSIYAFKNSLKRILMSYKSFIESINNNMFVTTKIDVFEDAEDLPVSLQEYKNALETSTIDIKNLSKDYIASLKEDFNVLKELYNLWQSIQDDSKFLTLVKVLKENEILKNSPKIIIFTESTDTASYLTKKINEMKNELGEAIAAHGGIDRTTKNLIISNFDDNCVNKQSKFRFLVTTDVLSEGVNLHQANVIINYDIPWNSVRIMQRVGRINRINSRHKDLYVFNFFPFEESQGHLSLKEIVTKKALMFYSLLGDDFSILTEKEVPVHKIFTEMFGKDYVEDDFFSNSLELETVYKLKELNKVNKDFITKMKSLPKKIDLYLKDKNITSTKLISFLKVKDTSIFIEATEKEVKEITSNSALSYFENFSQKIVNTEIDKTTAKNLCLEELKNKTLNFLNSYSTKNFVIADCGDKKNIQDVLSSIRIFFATKEGATNITKEFIKKLEIGSYHPANIYKIYNLIKSNATIQECENFIAENILKENPQNTITEFLLTEEDTWICVYFIPEK